MHVSETLLYFAAFALVDNSEVSQFQFAKTYSSPDQSGAAQCKIQFAYKVNNVQYKLKDNPCSNSKLERIKLGTTICKGSSVVSLVYPNLPSWLICQRRGRCHQ